MCKGGKADERINGAASNFRKALAIFRAVGAGPFARDHGSRSFVNRFFPPELQTRVASSDAEEAGRRLILVMHVVPEEHCSWCYCATNLVTGNQ